MDKDSNLQIQEYQEQGYQIQEILGTNKAGGRVTYLATEIKQDQPVVIKEFQFAKSQSTWSDYEAYEREIEVLKQLSYPNIPQYLTTIETPSGFALVQEYKQAIPLSKIDDLSFQEIIEITTQILEVLVYLQSHKPPIFHRDLKPENILIDRQNPFHPLYVYVIDFGFARKGGDNIAMSSVVKGTLGFMPPEQLYNQKITTASDLYSLGMTIVSLLTKTPSYKIGELIDHHGKLNYKKALAYEVNKRFIKWLDQMIDTNINKRFPDAKTALSNLQNLDQTKFSLSKIALTSPFSKGIALVILLMIGYSVIKNHPVNNSANYPQPPIIESTDPLIKQLLETKQCINCNLAGADLSGMNLKGVNLMGANLQNAKFNQTQLESANLKGANLQNADLINSNLTNANLMMVNLENANLSKSHFENANLMMANFENANLSKAVFWNANLINTNLENAKNMNDANLKGATLPNSKRAE